MRIGIDLGGTSIKAGIVTDGGEILARKSVATEPARGVDAVIADIIALCEGLITDEVQSIGIGCPGTVEPPGGTIILAANIGFADIPIGQIVSNRLNLPVYVENDANCAALAESRFGAARNSAVSATITFGTGIGGGIVIDGKIFSGGFFGAGEVGHQIIRAGGEPCNCGNRGCFEVYASAAALLRRTGGLSLSEAFETHHSAIYSYLDDLSIGLSNIINILQPEIMVIGGGISILGEPLIAAIKSRLASLVLGGVLKTRLKIAQLGNDAGIIGAALLY
ncbi:MAG: ROK family protein [Defluviitaleaceae bacterium]|nr:ROK family protein [Defluviitaleaceae bacterium]